MSSPACQDRTGTIEGLRPILTDSRPPLNIRGDKRRNGNLHQYHVVLFFELSELPAARSKLEAGLAMWLSKRYLNLSFGQ